MNRSERLPRLDGFRGLALVLVVELHLFVWHPSFGGAGLLSAIRGMGWIGIDLFFVLSGFLITGILYDERGREARRYFTNFFARRSLRVFPLYFLLLGLYQIFVVESQLVSFGDDTRELADVQMPWLWLYGIGIWVAKTGESIVPSLAHLWSVSVEEHFYFLWPFVMFFSPKRWLKAICTVGVLVALGVRLAFLGETPPLTLFVLTPFRMDGFFAGGLAALLYRESTWSRHGTRRAAVGLAVLCAVILAIIALHRGALDWNDPNMQSVGYSILEIGLAAWLFAIVTGPSGGIQSRFFESRFLRFLGKYSYGFYLFHYPIHVALLNHWTRHQISNGASAWIVPVHAFLVAAASMTVALLTWNTIEKNFLKLKSRFE